MKSMSFDEAVSETSCAILAKFGLNPLCASDTLDVLSDSLSGILERVVDRSESGFQGPPEVIHSKGNFDGALDDATHLVLWAFHLKAGPHSDTADLINDKISEIMKPLFEDIDE